MILTPTVPTVASFGGDRITLDIQEGVQLSLTVHEAMLISRALAGEATTAMQTARFVEPEPCQVIAFPAAKVRKALAKERKATAERG